MAVQGSTPSLSGEGRLHAPTPHAHPALLKQTAAARPHQPMPRTYRRGPVPLAQLQRADVGSEAAVGWRQEGHDGVGGVVHAQRKPACVVQCHPADQGQVVCMERVARVRTSACGQAVVAGRFTASRADPAPRTLAPAITAARSAASLHSPCHAVLLCGVGHLGRPRPDQLRVGAGAALLRRRGRERRVQRHHSAAADLPHLGKAARGKMRARGGSFRNKACAWRTAAVLQPTVFRKSICGRILRKPC